MAIALLTDFGTRDPYVAAMKGVIASRTNVPVVDLTHEIAPFDVLEAAWFLRAVVWYWPAGTIFVCVVDPGVGSERRILAEEGAGRIFLAPDNGLLRSAGAPGDVAIHSVENTSLFLPTTATTFHGRDRFAPVAAAIANGLPLHELGPRVHDIVTLGPEEQDSVIHIDRFGNIITNIEASRIPFVRFALQVNEHVIDRMERHYQDAAPGPFLIVGSTGHIEISIANGSAAELLQVKRHQRVEIRPL
jgi:S-adenosylmethionine hydrolase